MIFNFTSCQQGAAPPEPRLHSQAQETTTQPKQPLPCLQEYCRERLGESQSRLRCYSFDEVRALNAAGGCWLILDGMVLDVSVVGRQGGRGALHCGIHLLCFCRLSIECSTAG